MGLNIPSPSEIADPQEWIWRNDNHPDDIGLTGMAEGVYGWGGSPFGAYASMKGSFTKAELPHWSRPMPPELLDLLEHPERAALGIAPTGRPRDQWAAVKFTLSPPVPTPEPTSAAVFGILLGGWLGYQRQRRRAVSP